MVLEGAGVRSDLWALIPDGSETSEFDVWQGASGRRLESLACRRLPAPER